jgi:hypothetical protein
MHPIEQPTQAEATKAQGDSNSLQSEVDWGAIFFRCYMLRREERWRRQQIKEPDRLAAEIDPNARH